MLDGYKDVLSTDDLCEILTIGRKTVYQLLRTGEIPARRIGREYRVRKDVLIDYLSNC